MRNGYTCPELWVHAELRGMHSTARARSSTAQVRSMAGPALHSCAVGCGSTSRSHGLFHLNFGGPVHGNPFEGGGSSAGREGGSEI